ncbi:MAG: helix-turn-helix domain-containing protein [Clostridiales bacterium]|nr:helix-turn-helix domain-containing protein [Clostridiales bacterium]
MDIVSRLKDFISYLQLTNSQFADSCRIPRPSLSQLLNGRNKKVSDEIVAKIHEAFPQLSVLWLLFGEGGMVNDGNIQFSEPQNIGLFTSTDAQHSNNQNIDQSQTVSISNTTFSSEKFPPADSSIFDENSVNLSSAHQPSDSVISGTPISGHQTSIKLNPSTGKRITNIVVFYDDNSFQSFSPS